MIRPLTLLLAMTLAGAAHAGSITFTLPADSAAAFHYVWSPTYHDSIRVYECRNVWAPGIYADGSYVYGRRHGTTERFRQIAVTNRPQGTTGPFHTRVTFAYPDSYDVRVYGFRRFPDGRERSRARCPAVTVMAP